jgi:protein involved in polysaccharide export with SLBB domain
LHPGTHGFSDRQSVIWKRKLYVIAAMLILVLQNVPFLGAQQRNNGTTNASDLALQNLSHVAASPAEIKSVLLKDTGLLVELKRWVAKDATDHGQVVTDMDLTNDSIFDRLETDVQFRSVATALLQRFGYLIPNLNPSSDAAKEHELLVQERTKWLAQNQEEELADARQAENRNLQFANSCDIQHDTDCNTPQTPRATSKGARQEPQQNPQQAEPPSGIGPGERNPSSLPSAGGNTMMRAQLTQTDPDAAALFAQNPMLDTYDSGYSPNIQNVNSSESLTPQRRGASTGTSPGAGSANGESSAASNTDGLLAAYGSGMGTNASNRESSDARGMDGFGASNSPGSLAVSQALAMQPSNRRSQSAAISEPSEMMRKAGPYNDIPSLYDMYVQAVTRPASPRRFGAEIFENGTRDSQLIPMDLPVGPDYVVGPGDGLSVDLWGGVSQRLYRTVDREGRISLPEAGPILVSGKSLAAVQENVQQIMRTQFRGVSADVSLSRLRTIRIYEVGDIVNPGAYDIASLSTPLNALFVAGGPTQRGSMRILKHYRGTQLVETVDVYDLLLHGVKMDLQRLENGDTVQVPSIGPQVTVEGMVRRPAIYELRDEKNLASVLELAGGLLPAAALRHIEVQRMVAHDKQTMLSLDIPDVDNAAEVTKKFEAFEIQDGDRIRIYPIVPYNQDTVFIQGHVVRPGRYSFREGMRVTDLLSSYKDLLPEPAGQYAEIIRLNPPDFHPSVESFDLGDALANPSNAPVLHALDTVRIFSRFDFENPPSVSVLGDVRFPGTYQTPGQIHLADAVHVAGGLTPNAQTADAQVFRTLPDGKFKVFSVNLSQALGGDPVENIILQSHDRLLIHKNADAVEPATVYIRGEVGKPGRYPLATNMQVADLIRIGGGLKPSADTQDADLTKYDYSNPSKLTGQHEVIALAAALAGNSNSNAILHNGDVLTIRQLPGWNDLGASIAVRGEVKHPGTYGIRPGERLSAVLERAGGFQAAAYPYGSILQRVQVRELEVQSQSEVILRVKSAQSNLELLPETDAKQKEAKLQALQQWQSTLDQLNSNPPPGRVTIRISSKIDQWKNTAADIEVRAGDVLVVPKRPSYVMVTGQVFNPTAVAFRPGKTAKWYLGQSGGPTQVAYKKEIFVIRADGSVAGSKSGFLVGESLNYALQPGDTIVVPEKALGGTGLQWQTVMLVAQTASAIASTVIIALHY